MYLLIYNIESRFDISRWNEAGRSDGPAAVIYIFGLLVTGYKYQILLYPKKKNRKESIVIINELLLGVI